MEAIFGKFGLTGNEYQGIGRDIALAIPMGLLRSC